MAARHSFMEAARRPFAEAAPAASPNASPNASPTSSLRIDRLLFFLRLTKSRSLAQKWVEQGHLRVNGQRVSSAHYAVKVGDVLTLPPMLSGATDARVLAITELPHRRGPAEEARSCYCEQ